MKPIIHRVIFRGKDIQVSEDSKSIDLGVSLDLSSKVTQALISRLGFVAEIEEFSPIKKIDYQTEFEKQMDFNSNFHKPYFDDSAYLGEEHEPFRYGTTIDSSDEEVASDEE